MGGDDFDELVLVASPAFQEIRGDGEVLVLAVALWEGLVGDDPDEVLQEGVLATVGRPWVGLEGDDLFANEGGEKLADRVRSQAAAAPTSDSLLKVLPTTAAS